MIEKMKKVCVVSAAGRKEDMLNALRDLGILHLAAKKAADRESTERFAMISKALMALDDYKPDKEDREKLLPDGDFEKCLNSVLAFAERKAQLAQERSAAAAEIDRIMDWGDFSPEEVKTLRQEGWDLHFYRMSDKDYREAAESEQVKLIRLAPAGKQEKAAVLGTLPPQFSGTELALPEKSLSELREEIAACDREAEECSRSIREAAVYRPSFRAQLLKAQNAEIWSSASETAENDDALVWLSGYIPEQDEEAFKKEAAEKNWAWAIDDAGEDDDGIPTKLRFNKVSRLLKPILDLLNILPGYREQDISLWFFLFFVLFFAMIIGDAGYGLLIMGGAAFYHGKTKKVNDLIFLLYVLSAATILWGMVTGTWFGIEKAMDVPLLKALVIPGFANYPQYFNVTAAAQQNNIMKLSFTLGAVQMALGSLLAVRKKVREKDLSFVADIGWIIAVVSMYLLALYLVIGENIPVVPVFGGIGLAFLLVVIFGGMAPDKTFAQGLKTGLADSFTVFLNTISCFGNVMSYIRLFAVGMAGLAISQSFNGIAAGFKGPLVIAGIIVVIIGHALNIVMGFLSVVVHGVRLNVLEFSGQAGIEWAGIPYEPFRKNDKIQN